MHNALLHRLLVQARTEDFRRAGAASARVPTRRQSARTRSVERSVTLRFGFPDDAGAIARLAALDSSEPPPQPVLLAEVEGELRAALSLSGAAVADPFHPTVALMQLLRARADQLQDGSLKRPGRTGSWARFGLAVWR